MIILITGHRILEKHFQRSGCWKSINIHICRLIILIGESYLEHIVFICLVMADEYIEDHFDDIIGHESEIESRLIKEDCTINDLKQCNRWFIEAFGNTGEKVVLIEDDFDKVFAEIQTGKFQVIELIT